MNGFNHLQYSNGSFASSVNGAKLPETTSIGRNLDAYVKIETGQVLFFSFMILISFHNKKFTSNKVKYLTLHVLQTQ